MRRTCLPRLHRRQRKHANSIHKHDIFSLYTFFYIYILYTSCIYIFSILIAPACHDSTADRRVARSPHIKFIYSLHILSFICIFIHIAPACLDSTADSWVARSPYINMVDSLHIFPFLCTQHTHRTCMPRLYYRQQRCSISICTYQIWSSLIFVDMHIIYTSHLHAKGPITDIAEVLSLHKYSISFSSISIHVYIYYTRCTCLPRPPYK